MKIKGTLKVMILAFITHTAIMAVVKVKGLTMYSKCLLSNEVSR